MSKSLFQNPKKAATYVGATMVAVVMLVGSEDQEGALVQAAASVGGNQEQPEYIENFQPAPPPPRQNTQYVEQVDTTSWADDDDLIDDTSGFDPTPDEFDPADGDMYIVEN